MSKFITAMSNRMVEGEQPWGSTDSSEFQDNQVIRLDADERTIVIALGPVVVHVEPSDDPATAD